MGVDYDRVGGIGIKATDKIISKLIEQGVFTEEEYNGDPYSCMEKFGGLFSLAGNSYTGNE